MGKTQTLEASEENKIRTNAFNPREVEWILDQFPLMKSKLFNRLLEFYIPFLRTLSNYINKPLFKLFKRFGSNAARFYGIEPPKYEVIRLKEYLIQLQDGAKLATDVYLPKPVFEERYKAPTILIRLPYWKDMINILGYFFASMGYVTVLQDTRGCAHSKPHGTNTFLMFEGADGLQTLLWITKRFWYNGKIGMWGMSYFGITQLAVEAAMTEEHKGLVTCMNPGFCSYHSILYHPYGLIPTGMGASVYSVFYSITKNYTLESISDMFDDPKKIPERLSKYPKLILYNEKLNEPSWVLHFNDLAKIEDPRNIIPTINEKLGLKLNPSAEDKGNFAKLLKLTAYERKLNPQSLIFPHGIRFNFKPMTPMLFIAGWYDMFIEEFFRDLKLFQKAAPEWCKTDLKVVIGPWGHGGMDAFFDTKGEISKSTNMKDIVELARRFMPMWWFRHFLKEGKRDISKIPAVQLYILNSKKWRNFESWPPKTEKLKLYLHSGGKANTRFGDGSLAESKPLEESADEYTFDPMNPAVMWGGRNLFFVSGPHNQAKIEERTDVLVYTTDKLREGIEIIGEVKLVVYASSSAKDTDFMAKLVDVFPNGKKALNIIDDGIRARFRDGDLENATLIEPSKIYKYEFSLGNTAIYFPAGHRIRLEISSSCFPRFDINSNLGGEENDDGYIKATQKILHNAKNPSHLILPVYKKGH